ncbi:hypothetical protein [Nocardia sp. CA-145437]|uniref:hypothetical protein n=1 Tax=Nocardia sp. CA-145437 TaxID=3239980 RepID=UPI003D958858
MASRGRGEVTGQTDCQDPEGDSSSDEFGAAWTTGLSLTGAAVLFVVLRLFAVSDYDREIMIIGIDHVRSREVIKTMS